MMSSPATVIRPDVGSTSRLIIFSVVVLPQPDGPTSTTISPSATSSERLETAAVGSPEKTLVTASRRIIGSESTGRA
jgi:hypothetical protein